VASNPTDRAQIHPTSPTGLWAPLRIATFRNLLIADVISDMGTFMQSVGAAWLMLSFGAGPMYVALTQTASSLPFFVLALPAGALGDIVDRRKLILLTETWMVGVAIVLAVVTIAGRIAPWQLLVLTFAISAGDAFETPSWRAVLPDLVPVEHLPAASALNGIEFNFARAVGPALAGALIAVAGVGTAFVVNALSFAGVILVIARWKRRRPKSDAPAEHIFGATAAGLRYVRYAPTIRGIVFRAGFVMLCASGLLALLPLVAQQSTTSPLGYGILLGCFGAGAIVGALAMRPARSRWSIERVVSVATVLVGVTTIATGVVRTTVGLCLLMLLAGGGWIVFISLFSVLVQTAAPDWVRARVLAVFMLIFQGGTAAGSAWWGWVGQRAGIETALLWAGIGTILTAGLGLVWQLPSGPSDISPWNHWRMPVVAKAFAPALDEGPVLVTVEYDVMPGNIDPFLTAMHDYERVRRRDGASRWDLYRDTADPDRFVETFLVRSWAEHLRQHARQTRADRRLEERISSYLSGTARVQHLIDAYGRR